MKEKMKLSEFVGISCWGFILGIITLVLSKRIVFDFTAIFFFAFLCIVGIGAAAHASKK